MAFSFCRQGVLPLVHFLLREHPVNQSPSFVGATFSPRRHIAPLVYCIYLWSRYLPEAKNMLPHGASRFFASRKTEWFRLTGRSLKEKAGVKSDNGMERVTLRPPTPHPPLRGPPSPTGEGEREPFFRKGHSICPRFRQNLTSVGEGSPLPFVGHYALHAGDQWSPLQQGWSPSESPHPTLTQSVNRGGA